MQNIKNKNAASQIIIAVFIILISLSSISILFIAANNIIKPSLSPQISCIDMQFKTPIKIEQACYNKEMNEIEVTITHLIKDEIILNELSFLINSNESNEKYSCSNSCGKCTLINPGQTKKYFFGTRLTNPQEIIIKSDNCLLTQKEIILCS